MEETFNTPCTPLQDGEEGAKEEVRKYNSERTYDIGDIRKTMKMILPKEYLERTDLTNAEKRVLAVILHTCRSDAYKKLGGYYPISNANLKTNAKIGSTGLTPITNHLKELGLIDFEQGEGRTKGKQRKATRYTILFDDKLIQKERFITDPIKPSEDPIKPSEDSIKPSDSSTINPSDSFTINPRTSTSVDNQEVTPIEDGKSGAVYLNPKGKLEGNLNGEVEGNLKLKRNLEGYLKVEGNVKGNLDGNVDVNVDGNGEVNLDGNVEGNLEVKGGVSNNNNNIGNTNNKMEELIKKLITSIDNNTRVKSEVDTKILDKLDKISTSIDSLPSKSNGEIQPSIDSKVIEEKDKIIEELQGEINKLKTEVNTKDEIIEELQGKLQSSSIENTSKSNGIVQEQVNTKVVEELQGKINKLQEDYTKVVEERDIFKKRFNDSEEFFKKVKAYIPSEFLGNSKNRKESSSKSNGIVQEEVDTKGLQQESSKEETKETPMQEQTPKADTKTASKTTVQEASKPKEVEIPKDEEERQLQELKDNETIKSLLENFYNVRFTDPSAHGRILNEIRKAYATKRYNQNVLQAFLDYATTYGFYTEKRDAMEEPKQEATETPKEETKVEESKQEETVTPSEESRDEGYCNPTFTDEQAQETLSRLPKANSRYGKDEDEDQGEVIDDDMPSDKEVAAVVGGSYLEENDPEF